MQSYADVNTFAVAVFDVQSASSYIVMQCMMYLHSVVFAMCAVYVVFVQWSVFAVCMLVVCYVVCSVWCTWYSV